MGLRWYHRVNEGMQASYNFKKIDIIVRRISGERGSQEAYLEILENGAHIFNACITEKSGLLEIVWGLRVGVSDGRNPNRDKIGLHYKALQKYCLIPQSYAYSKKNEAEKRPTLLDRTK